MWEFVIYDVKNGEQVVAVFKREKECAKFLNRSYKTIRNAMGGKQKICCRYTIYKIYI